MNKLFTEYTFDLINLTLLIMSGADQRECEWRSQSVKGLMRFWFRIAGGSKEEEKKIFGWGGDNAGSSSFQVMCTPIIFDKEKLEEGKRTFHRLNFGEKYLGYILNLGENKRKKVLVENTSMKITLKIPPLAPKEKILASLWLTINLGNFGSRMRKGFGSLVCIKQSGEIGDISFVKNGGISLNEWYQSNLKMIEKVLNCTPLSIKIFLVEVNLDNLGQEYKKYRGRNKDRRLYFGLPIKGFKNSKLERFAMQGVFKPIFPDQTIITIFIDSPKPKGKIWENLPDKIEEFLASLREDGIKMEQIYPQ